MTLLICLVRLTYGRADCPSPSEAEGNSDLVPVPPFPLFNHPVTDERKALVLNVVVPPCAEKQGLPVMIHVHGGSLLYGGGNLSIFDAKNLVSASVRLGKPIIAVNFNYRVGLGGFLASSAIERELLQDGFNGCGNFGLTDQQVAFEWVQRNIAAFGGNPDEVTAVGESAGGISISHQLLAKIPPRFVRAICMSGVSCALPSWTIEEHERLYAAVCRHFGIDPLAPDALEALREIPEQSLADETAAIQGVPAGTGNPCLDGVFHQASPNYPHHSPAWLKSYMIGDVYHEGVIFHPNILHDSFEFIRATLLEHVSDLKVVDQVLAWYDVTANSTPSQLMENFEHMAGDFVFKIPNYATARANSELANRGALYTYHFDQRSQLKNGLAGKAYHGYEILYLFRNLEDYMDDGEKQLAAKFSRAWIDFVQGDRPWESGTGGWMRWGPHYAAQVVDEQADERIRGYQRMNQVLQIGESGETWLKLLRGIDSIINKRMRMGTAPPL